MLSRPLLGRFTNMSKTDLRIVFTISFYPVNSQTLKFLLTLKWYLRTIDEVQKYQLLFKNNNTILCFKPVSFKVTLEQYVLFR
jgi:hypothetical protein